MLCLECLVGNCNEWINKLNELTGFLGGFTPQSKVNLGKHSFKKCTLQHISLSCKIKGWARKPVYRQNYRTLPVYMFACPPFISWFLNIYWTKWINNYNFHGFKCNIINSKDSIRTNCELDLEECDLKRDTHSVTHPFSHLRPKNLYLHKLSVLRIIEALWTWLPFIQLTSINGFGGFPLCGGAFK